MQLIPEDGLPARTRVQYADHTMPYQSMQTIQCHTRVCRPYHAIPEYADQTLFTLAHFSYDQLSTPFPISSQLSSEYSLLKCRWKPYFIIEASVRCQKQSTHRSEKYSILINAFLFPLKHITCHVFQPSTQALSTKIRGCQWKL